MSPALPLSTANASKPILLHCRRDLIPIVTGDLLELKWYESTCSGSPLPHRSNLESFTMNTISHSISHHSTNFAVKVLELKAISLLNLELKMAASLLFNVSSFKTI